MEFIVCSRDEIESGILVRTSYIVISITDPGSDPVKIPKTSGLKAVHRVEFHDAEPVEEFVHPPGVVLMNRLQTNGIWRFIQEWERSVGTVVVHCEQGMSRSPAVAAALAKVLNGDDKKFFQEHIPNAYVYNLMLEKSSI